jgi:hypothetical protein
MTMGERKPAAIPGSRPILEGGGGHARYLGLADEAKVGVRRADFATVVRPWCGARDADA